MSFGFSIGDFCAVGNLAWTLYQDCYKVARGAPQEFQLLLAEISTLSNAFKMLQEEAMDPNSALVQSGENRVQMVNEMVKGIADTLKKLEKVAKKYQILGSSSKRRQLWTKFKWSVEFSDIDSLRSKLVYHNSVMSLLLTSVGNSSLERVLSSNAVLQSDVRDIKGYISGNTVAPAAQIPALSIADDEVFKASLGAALMRNAEIFQPWSTIGVDVWIEAGRWWLIRSQMELHTAMAPEEKIPMAAYANLIKSSWILVDIIACHPQFQFITASTRSEVQSLSSELKAELRKMSTMERTIPDLNALEGQDLRIWEVLSRTPLLRPHKDSRSPDAWKVASGEEVLFQRFALCETGLLKDSLACMVLFLVQGDARAARLVAQHQDGSIIMTATFEQRLSHTELENSVTTNDVEFMFNTDQDAQTLSCMIETTNWYLHMRTTTHADLDDLKAYVLLTAVKDHREDVVARLLPQATVKGDELGDIAKRGAPSVGFSLASSFLQSLLQVDEEGEQRHNDRRYSLSLLAWALQCGHTSLVELLAEEVSILGKDEVEPHRGHKMTALGLASLFGHETIVRTLLAKGADPHEKDDDGGHALCYASGEGWEEIVKVLLGHWTQVGIENRSVLSSSLHDAASRGHESIIRILKHHGADINWESRFAMTPVMHAVLVPHEATVKILLEEGANPLATNSLGKDSRYYVLGGVGGFQRRCASMDLVELVFKRACEIMHPSGSCPPLTRWRRAQVSLSTDNLFTRFLLYSHHAYLELPPGPSLSEPPLYNRHFNLQKSCDTDPPITYNFSIVHQHDSLEVAVEVEDWHISRDVSQKDRQIGHVKLQVVGGGTRSFSRANPRKAYDLWSGIELNPDSEFVEPHALTPDGSPIPHVAHYGSKKLGLCSLPVHRPQRPVPAKRFFSN